MLRLAEVVERAIVPALTLLGNELGSHRLDSPPARIQLLASGLQESGLELRRQLGDGPARGLWQFEKGTEASRGGVWGVYLHRATHDPLRLLCRDRDCEFAPRAIWAQLEHDDVLAAGVARLLLWTDPKPLPPVGAVDDAWEYYLRTWHPGKPRRRTWDTYYRLAVDEVVQPLTKDSA